MVSFLHCGNDTFRLAVVTFFVCEGYLLVYSIVFSVLNVETCESPASLKPWSALTLWLVTHCFACLVWVYVIIYIFWPHKQKQQEKR